jgi:hypothetical protein
VAVASFQPHPSGGDAQRRPRGIDGRPVHTHRHAAGATTQLIIAGGAIDLPAARQLESAVIDSLVFDLVAASLLERLVEIAPNRDAAMERIGIRADPTPRVQSPGPEDAACGQ